MSRPPRMFSAVLACVVVIGASCGDDDANIADDGGSAGTEERDPEGGAAGATGSEPDRGGDGGVDGSGDEDGGSATSAAGEAGGPATAGGSGGQNAGGLGSVRTGGTSSNPTGSSASVDTCAEDCDDGFDCTIDACSARSCVHTIGPNEGETACPSGRYCTVEDGCVTPPACATDEDCIEAWADDACKDRPRCDPASSLCLFDILDKDNDGHAPQVCGGDDCDDTEPPCFDCPGAQDVFPGAPERCNGADDNCDGEVDEQATCDDPNRSCARGNCWCNTGLSECGADSACVDMSSDPVHCGACGNACSINEDCIDGECECTAGTVLCDDGVYCGVAEGDPCDDSSGPSCCYGTLCEDGVCRRCRGSGESCAASNCCGFFTCEGGTCCTTGECTSSDECCSGYECGGPDSQSGRGPGYCCRSNGTECQQADYCCSGYCDSEGRCDDSPDSGAGGTSGAGGAGGAGGEPGTAGAPTCVSDDDCESDECCDIFEGDPFGYCFLSNACP